MRLLFLRLKVFVLYGGRKRFVREIETSLEDACSRKDFIVSFRNKLSENRALDSEINSVLNETQEKLEEDIENFSIVLSNES